VVSITIGPRRCRLCVAQRWEVPFVVEPVVWIHRGGEIGDEAGYEGMRLGRGCSAGGPDCSEVI